MRRFFHPCVEQFVNEVKAKTFESCRKARSKLMRSRSSTSNLDPVSRLGLLYLKRGSVGALPTDKDGGFVILPKLEIQRQFRILVQKDTYKSVHKDFEKSKDLFIEYARLVQYILVQNQRQYMAKGYAKRRLEHRRKGAISKMKAIVKSNKPAGEVALRPIHATPGSPLNPGMKWLASMLRPKLEELPHLLKNTEALIKHLESTVIPSTAVLIKVDVKDFFVSGVHKDFVQESVKAVPAACRHDYKSMLSLILDSQFVDIDEDDQNCYKVCIGSDMGLRCSGEVSDAALWAMMEMNLIDNQKTRETFHIHIFFASKTTSSLP